MAVEKRSWFTKAEMKRLWVIVGVCPKTGDRSDWIKRRDEAAASLGLVPRECWFVDYVYKGKRRGKRFATKREADAFMDQTRAEIRQGIHTPSSGSKTVAEAWELWIDDCIAGKLELSTVRQRRAHLDHHVRPFIGHVKLSDLTTPMVYDFERALRKQGRSVAMRRKVITNLKTMLTFAQSHGPLVAQNVARGVRIRSDDRESSSGPLRAGVDFPSIEEVNRLIEASTPRRRPFLVTAVFTGLRLSELRGLKWGDVDLDAGLFHVRERADNWGNMGPTKSKAGKRDIPLAPIVVNTLREWQDKCPKGKLNLVFPNNAGNIDNPSNIENRVWFPLQIRCGLTVDTGELDAAG